MAMKNFKAAPLPIAPNTYSPEYMRQLVRVVELYFRQLDSFTPLQNESYNATDRVSVGGVFWAAGTGTPEGAVIAPVGSLYSRLDGGTGTALYVKETGTGNTGWAAK